jgi:hypothetical protein
MHSALFPAVVLAVVAAVSVWRIRERRRISKLKISGGRLSLFLNLRDRGP